jgi:hypothetical protein
MIKCVCYIGLGSNGYFMADATLTISHYRTAIISGVGHPKSDSIELLVLCMVACNIWGTSVVLLVSKDSAKSTGNG